MLLVGVVLLLVGVPIVVAFRSERSDDGDADEDPPPPEEQQQWLPQAANPLSPLS